MLGIGMTQPGADFSYIFPGKILGKIPRKIFPKMLGKMKFSTEKSFENSFFQEIPRTFPRKVIFRGKNVRKIGPRSSSSVKYSSQLYLTLTLKWKPVASFNTSHWQSSQGGGPAT
jgi:hypothetical protein